MSAAYSTAWETLTNAIGAANGYSTGTIVDVDHLTVDQRIAAAHVVALLSISEELSAIRHQGINAEYDDGR